MSAQTQIYNHRPLQPNAQGQPPPPPNQPPVPGPPSVNASVQHFADLLEAAKAEFEQIAQESHALKAQRDDFENRVGSQVNELNIIRQALYELETQHGKIRQQYESELSQLRAELAALHHQTQQQQQQHVHPPPPPNVPPPHPQQHPGYPPSQPPPQQQPQDPYYPPPPPPSKAPYRDDPYAAPPVKRPRDDRERDAMQIDPSEQRERERLEMRERDARSTKKQKTNASSAAAEHPPPPRPASVVQPPPAPKQPYDQRERDQQRERERGMEREREAPAPAPAPSTTPVHGPAPPPGFSRDREREREYAEREESKPIVPKERERESQRPAPPPPAAPIVPTPTPTESQPAAPTSPVATNGNGTTGNGTAGGQLTMATLMDMDAEQVPAELKKEGSDWFAIFNPQTPRKLDITLHLSLLHESVVCCVRFSADGKYLATGCNRTAQIYDTKTGAKTCTLIDESVNTKSGDLYIRSVCFSPDGKLLATGAEDKQIRIWDIASRKIIRYFTGHLQEIYSLDFSRTGDVIVSGSGDKTARVWNMETGQHKVLSIHEPADVDAGVTSVAISADGRHVAAGSLDTIVRIWDVATGNLVERLRGHLDSVYSVAFTPDGVGLVSGSLDKTLKYWDLGPLLRSPQRTQALQQGGSVPSGQQPIKQEGGEKGSTCGVAFAGHKDYVLSVAVSPDGNWVVSGSKDRGVQFWDPKSGNTQLMLQGHKNSVISIDLSPVASPNGGLLASGSGDWMARLWSYTPVPPS